MIKFLDTDFQTILDVILAAHEAQSGTPCPSAGLLRHVYTVQALREVQLRILTNDAAAQSLLQLAAGDELDLVGDLFGVPRLASQAARCTVRVSWASALAVAYTVPAGVRMQTSDGLVIFATDAATEAAAGATYVDILCTATTAGAGGNSYPVGSVNTLLDTLAITPSTVSNTDVSQGGGNTETDARYRERIEAERDNPSTAGTVASYRAQTMAYSSTIVSVDVNSPGPGNVDVYALLAGGVIPGGAFIAGLQAHLENDEIAVVCDTVTAKAPTAAEFVASVKLDFYASEAAREAETLVEAERLITEWAAVGKEKLGHDIVPEEIVDLCQGLPGVYRVRVLTPPWTQVGIGQFPKCTSISVQIGNEYNE